MSNPRWKAPYRRARKALNARSKLCHWCGRPASEADHLVPVRDGGSDDLANLVPACQRCNRSRGAKPVDEWRRANCHGTGKVRQFSYPSASVTIFPRRTGPIRGDYSRPTLRKDYSR